MHVVGIRGGRSSQLPRDGRSAAQGDRPIVAAGRCRGPAQLRSGSLEQSPAPVERPARRRVAVPLSRRPGPDTPGSGSDAGRRLRSGGGRGAATGAPGVQHRGDGRSGNPCARGVRRRWTGRDHDRPQRRGDPTRACVVALEDPRCGGSGGRGRGIGRMVHRPSGHPPTQCRDRRRRAGRGHRDARGGGSGGGFGRIRAAGNRVQRDAGGIVAVAPPISSDWCRMRVTSCGPR